MALSPFPFLLFSFFISLLLSTFVFSLCWFYAFVSAMTKATGFYIRKSNPFLWVPTRKFLGKGSLLTTWSHMFISGTVMKAKCIEVQRWPALGQWVHSYTLEECECLAGRLGKVLSFIGSNKPQKIGPGQGGSVNWCIILLPKGCGFKSWSGHICRLWVGSPVWAHMGGNQLMLLSCVDVSLALFISF